MPYRTTQHLHDIKIGIFLTFGVLKCLYTLDDDHVRRWRGRAFLKSNYGEFLLNLRRLTPTAKVWIEYREHRFRGIEVEGVSYGSCNQNAEYFFKIQLLCCSPIFDANPSMMHSNSDRCKICKILRKEGIEKSEKHHSPVRRLSENK
jgi:hypothetical protein